MKTVDCLPGRSGSPAMAIMAPPGRLSALLLIGCALLLGACGNQQIRAETQQSSKTNLISATAQVMANIVRPEDLKTEGIALITPSSITGHEEDKQSLALAFTGVMQAMRPDIRIVPLPKTLSAINRAGLTGEYKQMFEDYRLTGIFERDILRKVAAVTGTRYLAQLKLAAFRQESKGRWGILGIRVVETKSSTIRLFLQIWDSSDGSVVWEGSQESTLSYESLAEEYVSMRSVVEESARDLVGHFP